MDLRQQRTGIGRAQLCVFGVICCAVAGCSSPGKFGVFDPRYGVSSSARLIAPGQPVPKGGGYYTVGVPYTIAGRTYVPVDDPNYRAEGVASWYGEDFHGRQTANGEIFDMQSLSAAHTTMPLPSYARVTNLSNSKSIIVRVNDRGPYHSDRVIDVSVRAATLLGFYGSGLAPVRVEYVGPAPLEGSDDNILTATLRDGGPAPAPPGVRVASNRPFISESQIRVWREVPVPLDRPYSLGDGQVHSSYRPVSGTVYVRAPDQDRHVPSVASVPPRDPPLTAYAPTPGVAQKGDWSLPASMTGASVRPAGLPVAGIGLY